MIKLIIIALSMRIPFLILSLVCVLLGASIVVTNQINISLSLLILTLLGALLAHISVNTLNEYFDFKSGLDFETIKTPFSGGSGALPENPEMANTVFTIAITSLITTLIIGCFFVWKYGAAIAPLGIAGLVLIVTYTGWINKHPFLCLIAPGMGFGFLMVTGSQFVLQGEYVPLSWLVALVPFFLVNNLLLLNQYPDIQADAKAGRNHFPIAYGIKKSNVVYGLFALATIATIVISVVSGKLPVLSLIALVPMPLAFFSLYGAIKYGKNIAGFPQYLGANVAVTILTTLLLGVSLFFG
ncbi:MAG: prenyltransferase [Gammaproteobacteria bacterium]|nr:prenyltransferase [Gammaproteobacteria bacterium]MCW8922907.1 prenyltransferase [Gammaproteobacteria bacterium]